MRGTTSALLMTLGVGFGIYASPHISSLWQAASERAHGERTVVSATAPASSPATAVEAAPKRTDDGAARVFSPQQPLFARVPSTPQSEPKGGAVVAVDQVAGPFRAVAPGDADARSTRPDETRRQLVRDLQRELRRVGCYEGELSGEWSPDVRRAMKTFTDRVNARLPLEQPDYILLTLVRGHTDIACGKGCPAGQAMADGGRCVPKGLVAKAQSREAVEAADASPTLKQSPQPALRKSNLTAAGQADRPTSSSSWSTAVAPAPSPVGRPDPAGALAAAPPSVAAPLPGRMTLGGAPLTTGSVQRPDVTGAEPATREQRRPADPRLAAAAPPDAAGPSLPPASSYQSDLPLNPAPTPRPLDAQDLRPPARKGTASRDFYDLPPRAIPPTYYSAPKPSKSVANRQWARKVFDNSNGR